MRSSPAKTSCGASVERLACNCTLCVRTAGSAPHSGRRTRAISNGVGTMPPRASGRETGSLARVSEPLETANLVTVRQVCDRYGLSETTIRRRIRNGDRLAAHITNVLAEAPTLTDQQRTPLAELLRPAREAAVAARLTALDTAAGAV